jgi:metal-responsive CopG/Arc/MetJ family transcriptional regulator
MPRPGPAMPLVAFRCPPELLAGVDALAEDEGGRSEVIRALLTEALTARFDGDRL